MEFSCIWQEFAFLRKSRIWAIKRLSHQTLLNSSLLACAIPSMILMEDSISQFQFSIQANYLTEPDLLVCLLVLQRNRWDSNYLSTSWKEWSRFRPLQPDTIFAEPLFSPWMAKSTFRSRIFLVIITICQPMHKIQLSISFLSWQWTKKPLLQQILGPTIPHFPEG